MSNGNDLRELDKRLDILEAGPEEQKMNDFVEPTVDQPSLADLMEWDERGGVCLLSYPGSHHGEGRRVIPPTGPPARGLIRWGRPWRLGGLGRPSPGCLTVTEQPRTGGRSMVTSSQLIESRRGS